MRTDLTVMVKVAELLAKLRENRGRHRSTFERAFEAYRQKVIEAMQANLDAAQEGSEVRTYIDLQEPRDHTAEYDQVIEMLEMEVRTEIEIVYGDFRRYVRDEWEWTRDWVTTNTLYGVQ